jgi:16S rRNA processing protein RimM
MPGFAAVGRIRGAWRTTNRLVVDSLTDFEDRFNQGQPLWIRGREFRVNSSERRGDQFLLTLEGIETFEDAAHLSGEYLQVPESQLHPLEPDTYYEHQIVGLRVRTSEGHDLGTIREVLHTGSNDVYVVESDGKERLIPAIEDVVKAVDLERGEMTVELLEGI